MPSRDRAERTARDRRRLRRPRPHPQSWPACSARGQMRHATPSAPPPRMLLAGRARPPRNAFLATGALPKGGKLAARRRRDVHQERSRHLPCKLRRRRPSWAASAARPHWPALPRIARSNPCARRRSRTLAVAAALMLYADDCSGTRAAGARPRTAWRSARQGHEAEKMRMMRCAVEPRTRPLALARSLSTDHPIMHQRKPASLLHSASECSVDAPACPPFRTHSAASPRLQRSGPQKKRANAAERPRRSARLLPAPVHGSSTGAGRCTTAAANFSALLVHSIAGCSSTGCTQGYNDPTKVQTQRTVSGVLVSAGRPCEEGSVQTGGAQCGAAKRLGASHLARLWPIMPAGSLDGYINHLLRARRRRDTHATLSLRTRSTPLRPDGQLFLPPISFQRYDDEVLPRCRRPCAHHGCIRPALLCGHGSRGRPRNGGSRFRARLDEAPASASHPRQEEAARRRSPVPRALGQRRTRTLPGCKSSGNGMQRPSMD